MTINLSKGSQGILLGASSTKIQVNLNWNITPVGYTRKGFLDSIKDSLKSDNIDIDIECLYELTDGTKGVLQALGNTYGSLTSSPFIQIDKDDRTGNSKNGESLFINSSRIKEIKRILIYGHLYSGSPNWEQADAAVTITPDNSEKVVIKLDEHAYDKRICALFMLEQVIDERGNSVFGCERLVQYFENHQDMDSAFKFGLRWKSGSK